METFQFLSSICKFANAYAEDNNTRKSVDFPMLSTLEAVSVPVAGTNGLISIPFNTKCVILCPSCSIAVKDLQKAPEMTVMHLGSTNVCVNKLLQSVALTVFDQVVAEIDMLFGRASPARSSCDLEAALHGQDDDESPARLILAPPMVPVIPLADIYIPSFSPPKQQQSYEYNSSPYGRICKSNASVVTLAKIFIGGKILRMQRFIASFFGEEHAVPCVIFTGFGTAGSVCQILSCMIKEHYGLKLRIKCVTYGSPASGDAAFASEYTRRTHRNYNIVLQNDLLVSVLKKGYKHPKSLVKLGLLGNYILGDMFTILVCCKQKELTSIDDYHEAICKSMRIDPNNKTMVGSIVNSNTNSDKTISGHINSLSCNAIVHRSLDL